MQYKFIRFPDGKSKAVTFSYDDGTYSDVRLADTLTKYGLKGTFNLNKPTFNEDGRITIDEIKTHILDAGHEVAVHGTLHKGLGLCSPLDGIYDVLSCRLTLENTFGRIIRGMAYADVIDIRRTDIEYTKIKNYLTDLGIVYSRSAGKDNNTFRLPNDWHSWMPTIHHDNPKALEYIDEFLSIDCNNQYVTKLYPRLFFVWGHSIEFERKNNWERLDELCEKLSEHEDIWYATNMEIYEYVQAFYSLVFSVDNTMAHNPTQKKVWFNIDKKEYCIEPGQTIVIE